MSRAYRVRVRESITQVVRGEDSVGTTLEILEILPCEAMAELLAAELIKRGFEKKDERLVRAGDGVIVATSRPIAIRMGFSRNGARHLAQAPERRVAVP